MKKYRIEEVKCDITGGPLNGSVVAAVKFNDGKKSQWLTNVEYDGFPSIYLSDEDLFEKIITTNNAQAEDDCDNEDELEDALQEELDKYYIDELDGISLGEYDAIFDSISENPESPAVPLLRYLITITQCDPDDTDNLIENAKGKYIDEIDIPVSFVEEEWLCYHCEE